MVGAKVLAGWRELQPLRMRAREGFIKRDELQRFPAGGVPMGGGHGVQFYWLKHRYAVAFE